MCLTLPARVLEVNGLLAKIDRNSKEETVKIACSDELSVGDYVLYTGDYLIKKISPEEAQEINDLFGSYKVDEDTVNPELKKVLQRLSNNAFVRADLKYLLELSDENDLKALYSEANIIRKTSIKDHICIHAIIEFSNYCCNNCDYCGLRRDNNISRYRLTPEEVIDLAVFAANDRGYKILVLQSGEDNWYDEEKLLQIVRGIKERARVFLYLSIGDRSLNIYENLKAAGANGVLYRFETSNQESYSKLHEGESFAERLNNVKALQKIGYVMATGFLIGLPGQTIDNLADDLLLLKELKPFMPSLGPFVPSANTPLALESKPAMDLVLKVMALTRLLLPQARMPITTAMETLYGEKIREAGFNAGANSVMFNLTPEKNVKDYYIYENRFIDQEKKYEKWALFKGELSYQMLEEELSIKI